MGEGERLSDHQQRPSHQGSQSLDKAMATLDRRREAWVGLAPRVNVKIEFLRKLDGYDFTKNPYAKKVHPGMPLRDVFVVTEHLAVTMCLMANILVVLVFVRVLGTARLPSRIIVNLACANIVSALAVAVHAISLSSPSFTDNADSCRFIAFIAIKSFVLWYLCLCSALVERIVAVCLPSFYSRGQHILGPALLASPWAFFTLNMLLLKTDLLKADEVDAGYECNSHLNYVFIQQSLHSMPYSTLFLLIVLSSGLGLAMLLQNQTSGDVWEINRMQFEARTTALIAKFVVASLSFTVPLVLVLQKVRKEAVKYTDFQMLHAATQVSLYKGLGLLLVLLTRQEFRRQLVMVFESSETIRRTRPTNLLVAHAAAARSHHHHHHHQHHHDNSSSSSRQVRLQLGGTNRREASDSGESLSAGRRGQAPITGMAPGLQQVSTGHAEPGPGLVGRDKLAQVHAPEWLRKKKRDSTQVEDQRNRTTLFNRTISILAVNDKDGSDV